MLRLAWNENPSLAFQLATRFPSPKLRNDIRWLFLNFPEKALDEPDALEVLLGPALPQDVSFQLKVFMRPSIKLFDAEANAISFLVFGLLGAS